MARPDSSTVTECLVALNAGSTSLKFGVYEMVSEGDLPLMFRGTLSDLKTGPMFQANDAKGKRLVSRKDLGKGRAIDHREAMGFILDWLQESLAGAHLAAAGHRVLLGGPRYAGPVRINADVLDYLDSLADMEPSHQSANVSGARALAALFPNLPQVACFDNSFHATRPDVAKTYALPKDLRDAGARPWGFHGLSYDYLSRRMIQLAPKARRVIVAHLGGGASLCAMLDGRSVDTTMGLAALSGLPMATRCGDLPPEVLFYLMRRPFDEEGALETTLYERSGLLGLSGVSGDMTVLEDSDDPQAAAAIAHFVYAITKYAGAYAAVLGGLDALAFTGGIGENSAAVRAAVCRNLAWLGVELDTDANSANRSRISSPESRVSAWVVPTDEELMIAQHTMTLLRAG